MKNYIHKFFHLPLLLMAFSCNQAKMEHDASGTFEAVETIISAEASGPLLQFDVEEGQELKPGQNIGYVDSTQLFLKKKQLQAQITALLSRKPDVALQLSSTQEKLRNAEIEQKRVKNLVEADAATAKQLDDINSQVKQLKNQIAAQRSSLEISKEGYDKETVPLIWQIEQLNDQLNKCRVINPIQGTVLTKYAEPHEMVSPGKALYKIADLSIIKLRAYITGDQLPLVKLNQKVLVYIDQGKDSYLVNEGIVEWISDKAEFTPKSIQTKDERADKVYAIKVRVKNNGVYKIGMYGELSFSANEGSSR